MISMELVNKIHSKEECCNLIIFMTIFIAVTGIQKFKCYVSQQKIALSQEYAGKGKSLKSEFDLVHANKHKTKKHLRELEDELYIIAE